MKTIEIDDEVYGYLQSNAIPYIETPNATLRRLLFDEKTISTDSNNQSKKVKPRSDSNQSRKRQPNTDLQKLSQFDLIQEGQTLYLHDYQGNRVNGYEAIVSGKKLKTEGELFSMSELAKECLQKEGFNSDSVRGPAHWYNSDGVSMKDLWSQYLKFHS